MKTKVINVKIKKGHHTPSYKTKLEIYRWCLLSSEVLAQVRWKKGDYNLMDEDQKDWNKVFGTAGGILPTIIHTSKINYKPLWYKKLPFGYCWASPQHRNSRRIVWRYNPKDELIEYTSMYKYKNGWRHLPMDSTIHKTHSDGASGIVKFKTYGVFNLTPYFGGNEKAPCDLEFDLILTKK